MTILLRSPLKPQRHELATSSEVYESSLVILGLQKRHVFSNPTVLCTQKSNCKVRDLFSFSSLFFFVCVRGGGGGGGGGERNQKILQLLFDFLLLFATVLLQSVCYLISLHPTIGWDPWQLIVSSVTVTVKHLLDLILHSKKSKCMA